MRPAPCLEVLSYEDQLNALERMYRAAISDTSRHLYMSLAESVKQAREHNLNCRSDPNKGEL